VFAVTIAACGDAEPDQRKAFIEFLQKFIIDKPGAHVPKPTAEDVKSFGPYAAHYAVITDFNAEIDKAMSGPFKITQTSAPRSIEELLARRQDVKAMSDSLSGVLGEMRKQLTISDDKRAALRQPDDLKAVFSSVYERSVTAPAQAFMATVPVSIDGLQASLKLADYLDAHRTSVKVTGSSIQATDNKIRTEINQLLGAMNAQNQRLNAARERMRVVFEGR
jgi:Protein of unknown function (DUF3053)